MFSILFTVGSLYWIFRDEKMGDYEIATTAKIRIIKAVIVCILYAVLDLLYEEQHTQGGAVAAGALSLACFFLYYEMIVCICRTMRRKVENADSAPMDSLIKKRMDQAKHMLMAGGGLSVYLGMTWMQWTPNAIGLFNVAAYVIGGIYWIVKKAKIGRLSFSTSWKVKTAKIMMFVIFPGFIYLEESASTEEMKGLFDILLWILELALYYFISVMNKRDALRMAGGEGQESVKKASDKPILGVKIVAALWTGFGMIPKLAILFLPK